MVICGLKAQNMSKRVFANDWSHGGFSTLSDESRRPNGLERALESEPWS